MSWLAHTLAEVLAAVGVLGTALGFWRWGRVTATPPPPPPPVASELEQRREAARRELERHAADVGLADDRGLAEQARDLSPAAFGKAGRLYARAFEVETRDALEGDVSEEAYDDALAAQRALEEKFGNSIRGAAIDPQDWIDAHKTLPSLRAETRRRAYASPDVRAVLNVDRAATV